MMPADGYTFKQQTTTVNQTEGTFSLESLTEVEPEDDAMYTLITMLDPRVADTSPAVCVLLACRCSVHAVYADDRSAM